MCSLFRSMSEKNPKEQGRILKKNFPKGLDKILKNADFLFKEATRNHKNGHYRVSFFLGFTALEELGKASFLIHNWKKRAINEGEWLSSKSFRGHNSKIFEAQFALQHELIVEALEFEPNLSGCDWPINLHWKASIADHFTCLRMSCLYVDYNFDEEEWLSPSDIEIKEESKSILSYYKDTFEAIMNRCGKEGIFT